MLSATLLTLLFPSTFLELMAFLQAPRTLGAILDELFTIIWSFDGKLRTPVLSHVLL